MDQSPHPQTTTVNRQALRTSLRALLAELGSTGSEVAQTLRSAGIEGTQKSARDCALALYLRAVVTGDMRVGSVVVWGPTIVVHRTGGLRLPIRLQVPGAVRTFIAGFDRGDFPELCRDGTVGRSGFGQVSRAPTSS
jgi:hypothetical protein